MVPIWAKLVTTAFGVLVFAVHVASANAKINLSNTSDERLEAVGRLVPGAAALLLVWAAWLSNPLYACLLIAASLILMAVGRALYELIVFRKRS